MGVLVYLAFSVDASNKKVDRGAEQWAVAYWRRPIPPQGAAPATYLEPARGILPENCAACHPDQYRDWRESWHANAMGPGVVGQFANTRFGFEASCLECHAPLSEQWRKVRDQGGGYRDNPAFMPELKNRGIVCAACHLRKHRRHGPPLAEGKTPISQAIHGEPERTPHFEASEFCKGCHQHPTTTLHINGKTVENTYREWLDSPYPERGITCQKCHMPGRRHLWKGIHDRKMTLSGITITTRLAPEKPRVGDSVTASLTLRNSGTGHAFPTYTTPAVFLKAAFLDDQGKVVPGGHYEEKILQRRLDMSTRPWGEQFDTRILPGQEARLVFERRVPPGAKSLYLWVWVEPDQFYTGFFRQRLAGGSEFAGAKLLDSALKASLVSQYSLFSRTIPIGPPQGSARNRAGGEPRLFAPPTKRDGAPPDGLPPTRFAARMAAKQAAMRGR